MVKNARTLIAPDLNSLPNARMREVIFLLFKALVEQLRRTVKTDQIEVAERNVAIAVKNNKLFTSKRPVELIKRSADSPPLRIAI